MAEEEIKYCKHCKENNCGNILCREKVNYIKTLEESIEDWKADHEHNLELMKGLNERIAELEKENEELEEIRSGQVRLLESDLTRIEQLKRRIEFLEVRIKSLKSQIKGFENDFDYQNKVIDKYKEDLKKGKTCVCLIPVSTSTKLFHDVILPNAKKIEFVRGRLKFEQKGEDGIFRSHGCGQHDSMIVVF